MVEKIQYIPARLRNMAKEGHVAGTADIIDDDKNKTQEQINEEVIGDNAESHKNRIAALDQIHSINVDDQEHAITTNPEDIVEGSGLIPTANAVAGVKSELIDNYGHYAENPEFIRVYLDSEDKVLWGIQRDGNIYYGAGIPSQVIDYINEKIAELSLDEYEDIVAFLDGLEKGDKTLQEIINEINASIDTKANAQETADALSLKVDKVEGKSLIDEEYASGIHYIENPEYIKVELDSEERILKAIKRDGSEYLAAGLDIHGSISIDGADVTVIDNPEFLNIVLDEEEKVIEGIRKDGTKVIGGNLEVNGLINRIDIQDLKKTVDSNILAIEYDNETGNIYAITGEDSNMDVTMDEDGNIYVEQEIN